MMMPHTGLYLRLSWPHFESSTKYCSERDVEKLSTLVFDLMRTSSFHWSESELPRKKKKKKKAHRPLSSFTKPERDSRNFELSNVFLPLRNKR